MQNWKRRRRRPQRKSLARRDEKKEKEETEVDQEKGEETEVDQEKGEKTEKDGKHLQKRVKKQRRRKRKMMTKKIKTNLVKNETEADRGIAAPVDVIVARRSHAAAQRAAVETDLVEIAEIMGGVAEATPEIQIAATVEGEIAIVEDAVTGDLIEAVSEAMRLQQCGRQ